MKAIPRRRPSRPAQWLPSERELARKDRELFGARRSGQPALLNEQFFHLWQRIIVRAARGLVGGSGIAEAAKLETLSADLARAQRRRHLPPDLVRQLIPR